MDEDVAALVVDNGSGMCKVRNNTHLSRRERTTTAPQQQHTKLQKAVIVDISPSSFSFLQPYA